MSASDTATDVLTVDDVLARYHLKDRRAARRIICDAGGFVIANRAVVRRGDLLAHEDSLRRARKPQEAPERCPEG